MFNVWKFIIIIIIIIIHLLSRTMGILSYYFLVCRICYYDEYLVTKLK
jgi:hypothetical protein